MWWWILACAHRPVAPDRDAERVELDFRLTVETRADPEPPAEALPGAVDRRVRLDLLLAPFERERDDSTLWTVRYARARAPEPWPLEGRLFGLRRFDDGEVLRLAWTRHVVGGDRLGGVFSFAVPVASPWVPGLRDGAKASRTVRWGFDLGPGAGGWREVATLTWRDLGPEERGGETLRHLAYAGPWTVAGTVTDEGLTAGISGEGTAEGEVWLRGDGAWVDQRFAWTRRLDLDFSRPGGRVAIRQEQRFEGAARRVAAEASPEPPPYPDAAALRQAVADALVPAWQACVDGGEAWPPVVAVALAVAPDGALAPVEDAPLPASAGALPPCGREALAGTRLVPHAEDAVVVEFRVATVDGRVVPPMAVTLRRRPLAPVLLYRPPDRSPAAEAALRAFLGLPGGAPSAKSPDDGVAPPPPAPASPP